MYPITRLVLADDLARQTPLGPSRDGSFCRPVWDELARVGVGVIDRRGKGCRMTQGKERTKEQLMRQAKKLGIKGRSKMNKGALKAAVDRRS
jgi:hypothetical protein